MNWLIIYVKQDGSKEHVVIYARSLGTATTLANKILTFSEDLVEIFEIEMLSSE